MHFEEVIYKRNFRVSAIDPYIHETIVAKIVFNEGESATEAFNMAKEFVLEQGSKAVQYPDHQHIEINSLPPEPSVLPSIQVEKEEKAYSMEDEINSCQEFKVLESYYFFVKDKPELKNIYDIRKKQLVAKESQEIIDNTNA